MINTNYQPTSYAPINYAPPTEPTEETQTPSANSADGVSQVPSTGSVDEVPAEESALSEGSDESQTTAGNQLMEWLQHVVEMVLQQMLAQNSQNSSDSGSSSPSAVSGGGGGGGSGGAVAPSAGAGGDAAPSAVDGGSGGSVAPTTGAGDGAAPSAAGGVAPAGSGGGGGQSSALPETSGTTATPAPSTTAATSAGNSSDEYGGLDRTAQTRLNTPEESSKVAKMYMDNLQRDFGLTKNQAAGVVGNLWHESAGMNSGMNQNGGITGDIGKNMAEDNQNGSGIAQWSGARKQGLIDYAREHGLATTSQAASYGFMRQELTTGGYQDAISAVKSTSDVAGATQAFSESYLKPSEPNMASRVGYAQSLAA